MRRAVFLDRDGVLNQSVIIDGKPHPPSSPSEIIILDGVVEAIRILEKNGFVPVVVTNQPDVARGLTSQKQVKAINNLIGKCTNLEYFFTCFHDDTDRCNCRKPLPGLIQQASVKLNIDLRNSYLVGDRWRDVEAGQAAGCHSFFIDYSYKEKPPKMPFTKVSSLMEAVNLIIGEINGTCK
jgi:D-glycero-D-manno-heptose 1,7-bisphosphate phosphatase